MIKWSPSSYGAFGVDIPLYGQYINWRAAPTKQVPETQMILHIQSYSPISNVGDGSQKCKFELSGEDLQLLQYREVSHRNE